MNGTASYCPTCDEDRTADETIAVKKDNNGNGPFVGCRECNNRCVLERPENQKQETDYGNN